MQSILNKAQLNTILEDIVSPVLSKKDLTAQRAGTWTSAFINGIAKIFSYTQLKGGQGTFTWGVCFNFLPTFSAGQIKFTRTENSAKPHLFEWTDEYANSFFGGNLKGGICSEWGEQEARSSIKYLLNKYQARIFAWYDSASSIEGAIKIARYQANIGRSYKYHSPSPEFVLAFLLARIGATEDALAQFDKFSHTQMDQEQLEKLRANLFESGA